MKIKMLEEQELISRNLSKTVKKQQKEIDSAHDLIQRLESDLNNYVLMDKEKNDALFQVDQFKEIVRESMENENSLKRILEHERANQQVSTNFAFLLINRSKRSINIL